MTRVLQFWPLATSWAPPPISGATPTTLGTCSAIAWASSSERVWTLPKPWRMPPVLTAPGRMNSKLVPSPWMRSVTAAWAPRPTDISEITAATPMMMPSIVSSARSLFAPRARMAMRMLSPTLRIMPTLLGMTAAGGTTSPGASPVAAESCRRSRRRRPQDERAGRVGGCRGRVGRVAVQHLARPPRVGHALVAGDQTVAELDHPVRVLGNVRLMGDEHDGHPARLVQVLEEGHDLLAGARIERAGRLVGQDQARLGDQGASHRHPLLLPARQLRRPVVLAISEADGGQRGQRSLAAVGRAGVEQRQLDLLDGRHAGQQVEALEDEAQLAVADRRQLVVGEAGHLDAVELVATARGLVEAADGVHQRRLARARGAHDRDEFAAADADRHAAQGMHFDVAESVDLRDVADQDNRWRRLAVQLRLLYRMIMPPPKPPPGPPAVGARVCVVGMTTWSPSARPSLISVIWSLLIPRRMTRGSTVPSGVSTSTTWSRPWRRMARFGTRSTLSWLA